MGNALDTTLSTPELDGLFGALDVAARVELLKCLAPISQAAVVYSLYDDEDRRSVLSAARLDDGLRATLRVGLEAYEKFLSDSRAALMAAVASGNEYL